ncbi:EAL domain-containing protein [Motiliproteus sp. SC1-56]|uniref:bifunctional diguanylate cyclase/phosphodiesterase n=1 Tax=Motiliproteus sp. SC1-56 TaxID=2799565 RepID=UPI001A8CE951
MKQFLDTHPLSMRVLVSILLISTLLALAAAVIQLRVRYDAQLTSLNQRLEDARASFLPALTDATWRLDEPLIKLNLKALQSLPFINSALLETREGEQYQIGLPQSGTFTETKVQPLVHESDAGPMELGTVALEVDYSALFTSLRRDALVILATQSVKTFIVSSLILLILHRLIFRHLLQLRRTAAQLRVEDMNHPFVLDRAPLDDKDELEQLRHTLEQMRGCIEKGIPRLEQLATDRERVYLAANATPAAIMIFNAEGVPYYHNSAFLDFFKAAVDQAPAEQWLPRVLEAIPRHPDLQTLVTRVREQGVWQREVFWPTDKAHPRWIDMRVVSYMCRDRETFFLTVNDMTELRTARKREHTLLAKDRLTGLSNRRQALAGVANLLRAAQRDPGHIALVVLEVTAFKPVMESLGLEYADLLILEVADQIQRELPHPAVLGRVADNQFMYAFRLDSSDAQPVISQVEALRGRLVQAIELHEQKVDPGFCAGIAISPNDGDTPETLLKHAHSALRQAQRHERVRRWRFFEPGLYQHASRQLRIVGQITAGRLLQELELKYQPIVSAKNGQPLGCEALARWQSPELGKVTSDEFIAAAEQLGRIDQLGQHILRKACEQLAQWRRQGHNLFVSVNVSALQLHNPRFAEQVEETLKQCGLPVNALKIEITEQVTLEPSKQIIRQLDALKALGIALAIDDFGTGYASLNYLCDYPFNVLKIDQSFVLRMQHDPQGHTLVEGVVRLSHQLGLAVVAEGVETEALRRTLQEIGCDLLQGYLFSRPLRPERFLSWLEQPQEARQWRA